MISEQYEHSKSDNSNAEKSSLKKTKRKRYNCSKPIARAATKRTYTYRVLRVADGSTLVPRHDANVRSRGISKQPFDAISHLHRSLLWDNVGCAPRTSRLWRYASPGLQSGKVKWETLETRSQIGD